MKNKKSHKHEFHPLFLLIWLICSVLVCPLALIGIQVIFIPFIILEDIGVTGYGLPPFLESPGSLLIIGLSGAIIGMSISFLQRWTIREYLYWTVDGWRRYSVVGGIVGAWLAWFGSIQIIAVLNVDASNLDRLLSFFAMMPPFVVVVSIAQWIPLRKAVNKAWLWVFANFIAGIVYAGLSINGLVYVYACENNSCIESILPFLLTMTVPVIAMLLQGYITGIVMRRLFVHHAYPVIEENTETSVWEKAI